MIRRMMHLLALLFVAAGWAQAAGAQTFAVASITNVDVGRLAAAAVGETVCGSIRRLAASPQYRVQATG